MTTKKSKKKLGPGRRPIDPDKKRISCRVWMTAGVFEKIYFGDRANVQGAIDYDIQEKTTVQAISDAAANRKGK